MSEFKITDISVASFWDFSVSFYQQHNNQYTLLWLQDNARLNVNMLLLILYLGQFKLVLSKQKIAQLMAQLQTLDSLTSNLRRQRKALKEAFYAYESWPNNEMEIQYNQMLEKELMFEKQQQKLLISRVVQYLSRSGGLDRLRITSDGNGMLNDAFWSLHGLSSNKRFMPVSNNNESLTSDTTNKQSTLIFQQDKCKIQEMLNVLHANFAKYSLDNRVGK